jgi:hypothetical protein
MFGIFKMSEDKKAILAFKNLVSFRNMNENQLRKFSNLPITSIRISFTTQKIALLLDATFKLASFSSEFKYRDISTNKFLYEIIGDYFLNVFENQSNFPSYEEFKEHSDLIMDTLFQKLIDSDDTFRNKVLGQ